MTKEELLAAFEQLKADVAEFAKPSVHTPPTDVIDHHGIVQKGANPGQTLVHGEESTVGHINRWLDEAAALAATLVGKE